MKRYQKDNFTDATEEFQTTNSPDSNPSSRPDPYSATDNEGNAVTLGQAAPNHPRLPNKGKLVELTPEVLEAITKAVKEGVEGAIEKFLEKSDRKSS